MARRGNEGGIGKKHAETVETAHWLRSETQVNSSCFIFLQLEGICMEGLSSILMFSKPTNGGKN